VPSPPPELNPASTDATAPTHEAFEDEEQRFFSQPPPEAVEEITQPSSNYAREKRSSVAVHSDVAARDTGADEHDFGLDEHAPTPELSARQRQLRRRVASSMGAMLALLLLGFAARKHFEASEQASTAVRPRALAVTTSAALPAPIAPLPVATVPPAAAVSAQPAAAAVSGRPVAAVSAQLQPVPEVPPPPAPSTIEASTSVPSEEDASALIHTARSLLGSGHTRDGVAAAREALQKDPLDAEPYILLAAGLQDLGAWHEARDVFTDCLHKAKHGTSSACQYFARR
jgi:hypothetical protein